MSSFSGEDILAWRRRSLLLGGKKSDLDWLLDIGGGLRLAVIYSLFLYPKRLYKLEKSLDDLTEIWKFHLDTLKPLQYIIGKCPWRDFVLEVNSDVLIPRQETELLIDFALEKFGKCVNGTWLDMGTGAGPLAVALASSFPQWDGYAVDCSEAALSMAKKNLNIFTPDAKVSFYLGNWWEPLDQLNDSFKLILSNPPYIPSAILSKLEPQVRNYEPILALSGGEDGMRCCRKLIAGAIRGLCSGGWLIFEHHYDQSDKALELMAEYGFKDVSYRNDLNSVKRFAMGRRA